jgi:hypothetical protein
MATSVTSFRQTRRKTSDRPAARLRFASRRQCIWDIGHKNLPHPSAIIRDRSMLLAGGDTRPAVSAGTVRPLRQRGPVEDAPPLPAARSITLVWLLTRSSGSEIQVADL